MPQMRQLTGSMQCTSSEMAPDCATDRNACNGMHATMDAASAVVHKSLGFRSKVFLPALMGSWVDALFYREPHRMASMMRSPRQ